MRRAITIIIPIAAIVAAFSLGNVAHSKPKAGKALTVRVMRAKVMKAPRFIGATAGSVSRGDQLVFRKAKGDWYQVDGAATGWIHRSSVVEGQVKLSSKPGGGSTASRDEVELAGRGFTPQVESEYRDKNPNLDFSHVDAIESIEIDLEALGAFIKEGGLRGGGK